MILWIITIFKTHVVRISMKMSLVVNFRSYVKYFTFCNFHKGTQGFIHCLFNAAYLAMLNKQMVSSLATYLAFHWLSQSPASFGLAPQVS